MSEPRDKLVVILDQLKDTKPDNERCATCDRPFREPTAPKETGFLDMLMRIPTTGF